MSFVRIFNVVFKRNFLLSITKRKSKRVEKKFTDMFSSKLMRPVQDMTGTKCALINDNNFYVNNLKES